ncbi:MAG: hypothetical protein ACREMO_04865, partial [Gemmatimonadales bacterium]
MRVSRWFMWAALSAGTALACSSGSGSGVQIRTLNGVVRDYFTNGALNLVTLTVDGRPTLTAISSVGGSYEFADVPSNTTLQVVGSLANYRATRNEPIAVSTGSVVADLRMVSTLDANRQYTGLGRTPVAGTSVVFVDLVDAGGQPRPGIPVADITLVDGALSPVGIGPFVFGMAGDVVDQATLSVTTAFAGRSRVAFLDVPPGTQTLQVTVGMPSVTLTTAVVASAGGATLA